MLSTSARCEPCLTARVRRATDARRTLPAQQPRSREPSLACLRQTYSKVADNFMRQAQAVGTDPGHAGCGAYRYQGRLSRSALTKLGQTGDNSSP